MKLANNHGNHGDTATILTNMLWKYYVHAINTCVCIYIYMVYIYSVYIYIVCIYIYICNMIYVHMYMCIISV